MKTVGCVFLSRRVSWAKSPDSGAISIYQGIPPQTGMFQNVIFLFFVIPYSGEPFRVPRHYPAGVCGAQKYGHPLATADIGMFVLIVRSVGQ
jgi:hypothetical protein